jgi:hypothetical protein
MPEIIGGNLVPDAEDTKVAEFKADLDTGINWLDNAQSGWDALTPAEKQTWFLANFGAVLYIQMRVLIFIRWLVNRIKV